MKHIKVVIFILLGYLPCANAQSGHSLLRSGNKFYEVDEYSLAEEKYRESNLKNNDTKSAFNLGNALYKQGRFEEAVEQYQSAAGGKYTDKEKAGVFHNLGNAHFQNQNLEEAIDSYKQAIRLNPKDEATLHNLMMSRQIQMQMQEQQQEQENQDGEPQDQEDSENQEQQEQEDQGDQNEQEGEQEQEEQEEQSEKQDSSQIQGGGSFDSTRLEKQELDSLDAIKLLDIIDGEEQKVQEKLRKYNSQRKKQDKDW